MTCGHPKTLHDCGHACTEFWCQVSRREPMPTIIETQELRPLRSPREHRFEPRRVPGEGYQPACSCGWVASPADILRTYGQAHDQWDTVHVAEVIAAPKEP